MKPRRLIFMNEAIRQPEPSKPVIAVQTGERVQNTNRVRLMVNGKLVAEVRFVKGGLKAVRTHNVRAFVEVFGDTDLECV